MPKTDITAIFLNHGRQKNLTAALKNHPQIPCIMEAINRREKHHIALVSGFSQKIHYALIESLALHLCSEPMPAIWQECQIIYFSANTTALPHNLVRDFQLITEQAKQQRLVLIMDDSFYQHIQSIALEEEWRLIVFTSQINSLSPTLFAEIILTEPDVPSLATLLKAHRTQLENFHRVIIADDIVTHAYTLAGHYLSGHSRFDKTIELLDSTAAHVSLYERHDNQEQKPQVTSQALMQVIAHWTQIPLTHLHNVQFQAQKLAGALKKNIFGQDAAIDRMAALLQNACIKLQDTRGPLCNFLLAGPHEVGKTEIAYALAEYLFGQRDALMHLNPHHDQQSLTELMIFPRSGSHHPIRLLDAIARMPYGILLIENIEQLHCKTWDALRSVFEQGYVIDEKNQQYDFRHTIIIATTRTVDASQQSHDNTEPTKAIDLMQLVLNQPIADSTHLNSLLSSSQDLCDELMPMLSESLPNYFLQKFNIIPLMPLDYAAFEKIIRTKIKTLARRLHASFDIELSFAPETIKFLAHEALWRKVNTRSLEKLLEQHLYSTVTHEILSNAENKDRSKRLLIQLNDSGQSLRCEFMLSEDATLYSYTSSA